MRWLLLRGLVREIRHWGAFADHFERTFPGAQPLLLDLPGVGTEASREVPLSVKAMTDDLRARFLRRGGTSDRWGLLGISLGGMIALDWLSRYPSDFERGVVINASAGDAGRVWERLSWRQLPRVVRCFWADPLVREREILGMTSARSPDDLAPIAERHARYAEELPLHPKVALKQLAAAARSRLPKHLQVPALVLTSRGDRLVSPTCSERIAQRLGLPIRHHPWAGHDLPLDAPEWVTAEIRQWLATSPSEAAA